ncbi:MAG: hypothetical protein WA057_04110 [Candidatus Magasanikiibacteriota bacterium]
MSEPNGDTPRFLEDLIQAKDDRELAEGSHNLGEAIGLEAKYNMILEGFDNGNIKNHTDFSNILAAFTKEEGISGGVKEWIDFADSIKKIDTKEKFLQVMVEINRRKSELQRLPSTRKEERAEGSARLDKLMKIVIEEITISHNVETEK